MQSYFFTYVANEDIESFLNNKSSYFDKLSFLGDTGLIVTHDNIYGVQDDSSLWEPGAGDFSIQTRYSNCVAEGNFSLAEGYYTLASGYDSHAEGSGTKATASRAHAEGKSTIASGENSHSEGYETSATRSHTHSEGYRTIANGIRSHAEGSETEASGNRSHAEGDATVSSGMRSHAEGHKAMSQGETSHSEGHGTIAFGKKSHTEGNLTKSFNNDSHAEGEQSISFGDNAHAEGNCNVSNDRILYIGDEYVRFEDAIKYGDYILAEDNSFLLQVTNIEEESIEYDDIVFPFKTPCKVKYGDFGSNNGIFNAYVGHHIAWGLSSHVEGNNNATLGNSSHSEGSNNTSFSFDSHTEGFGNTAGIPSHVAIGDSGEAAHAEGYGTNAFGTAAHTEGYETLAYARAAHAEGNNTKALEPASHAEGRGCVAEGQSSHAEGYYTRTINRGEHACGRYNFVDEDASNQAIFSIGNGHVDDDGVEQRENVITVDDRGYTFIENIGNYDGMSTRYKTPLHKAVYSQSPVYHYDYQIKIYGQRESQISNTWDLINLDLTSYEFIKVYITASSIDSTYLIAPIVVDVHLNNSLWTSNHITYYTGSGMTICMNDQSTIYTALCAVDSTKTKFKIVNINCINNTIDPNVGYGWYLYKIEGWNGGNG